MILRRCMAQYQEVQLIWNAHSRHFSHEIIFIYSYIMSEVEQWLECLPPVWKVYGSSMTQGPRLNACSLFTQQ